VRETAGAHLLLEGGVVGVLDGLHADGECGGYVFGAVVDEEDVGGRSGEAFGGVEVDSGFGLGEVEGVRPGVMVEGFYPGMAGAEAGFHGIGHVGEDSGADAGALEALDPIEHGRIDEAPEVGVGVDEGGELVGGEDDLCAFGDFVPEGVAFEVAAVVCVAVGPVFAVEEVFGEAGDGAHALPGCGVGWGGEDHTVVEEDGLNWCH
jgi:hypothetical protein